MNKYIPLIIVGVLVLIGIYFLYTTPDSDDSVPRGDFTEIFQDELIRGGIERVGQPHEGFDAFTLREAFPKLTGEDFDTVKSLEGMYTYSNGKLMYTRTAELPAISGEQTLSTEGFATLLENVSERLDIEVESEADVTLILEEVTQEKNGGNGNAALIQEYFNEELREGALNAVGQPDEGFVPYMFQEAFPSLVPQDFDGVQAFLGVYNAVGEEIVFTLDEGGPIHSAADSISQEGMVTLLSNIQKRVGISVTTIEDVDRLLLLLGEVPRDPLPTEPVFECQTEDVEVDACIQVYEPVCGKVNVQCITTPCEPVYETFSNSCLACLNPLVESYTRGACVDE